MELRAARPGDELGVARVHVRAWQAGYRGLLPDAYLDALRAEERAARYTFGRPGPETIVAVDVDAIVGFATTIDDELAAFHVDPDHWRRGVGRALIARAREAIAARGHAHGVLWILDGNARAASFYAADGWAADGTRREIEVWGIRVPELRWRRAL
jgi:GNAT superfamily N-acetyltransferase